MPVRDPEPEKTHEASGAAAGDARPVDPEKDAPAPEDGVYYREIPPDGEHSWGDVDERHWSRARGKRNARAIEYYRSRSQAPGVAEGGDTRNQYCMACDGVIPLHYFQFEPADETERSCPHCGTPLEKRIHRMFNWVEIDQPHDSDLRAVLPLVAVGLLCVLGLGAILAWLFL